MIDFIIGFILGIALYVVINKDGVKNLIEKFKSMLKGLK